MNKDSPKRSKRVDYHQLHTTGEVVYTDTSHQQNTSKVVTDTSVIENLFEQISLEDIVTNDQQIMSTDIKTLFVKEASLADDITDFIEENSIENVGDSIEDIDFNVKRVEELRSTYRIIQKEIAVRIEEEKFEQHQKSSVTLFNSIKEYIIAAKKHRRTIKERHASVNQIEIQNKIINEKQKYRFIADEIIRNINDLEKAFSVNLKKCTDAEIKLRKQELINHNQDVKTLLAHFKSLMEMSCHDTAEVNKLQLNYSSLLEIKTLYSKNLSHEIEEREIEKRDNFKSSTLNINLPKFNGYNSSIDIYTFQTQFEKIYLKITPTSFLPDLLKNNYLENSALLLVKHVDDINEIWDRLKAAYGDHNMLLSKKISQLQNIDAAWRFKEPDKVIEALGKVINLMKDLMHLSEQHKIEEKLYHSDAINKVYQLIGDNRMMRWLSINCDHPTEGSQQWLQLIAFLEKEVKIHQQKLLIHGKPARPSMTLSRTDATVRPHQKSHFACDSSTINNKFQPKDDNITVMTACAICGASDHVQTRGPGGSKLVQYFACKKFVEMSPKERYAVLKSKGLCFQCLFPGANHSTGKHKDGRCQRDFVCKHPTHETYQQKKHVLVCDEHKDHQTNRDIFEHYKFRCISRLQQLELFSKEMKLSFHISSILFNDNTPSSKNDDSSVIYLLQTINVNNQPYTIFYDSGCGDFISRFSAIQRIGSNAAKIQSGPMLLGGIGGITTTSQHGIYSVKLPLKNGNDALFTGVTIDHITNTFPIYPLQGRVENDIHTSYEQHNGNANDLPKLPVQVGGDVDFMIGIKYMKYFPEQIFQLPSGLTIYRSCFLNSDGSSDGIIGGPHEIFNQIDNYKFFNQPLSFFVKSQHELFQLGYQVNPDLSLLGFKDQHHQFDIEASSDSNQLYDTNNEVNNQMVASSHFHQAELAGSEINFRCVKCRSCDVCKKHNKNNELISIKEEVEQDLINHSVSLDTENSIVAKLPFIDDPSKLAPNRNIALKVYYQQIKRLANHADDKADIIQSEAKLQALGYVDYIKNLSTEVQSFLSSSPVKNYIPWRAVWKESSTTTPCRIVFDASMGTESGYSLNDIIAKGRNNMNKLIEIFLRWRTHNVGFHTDVQKMYNSIKLHQSHWCFQRYLWQECLDVEQPPEEKVIMTLIYGVKSSGNQAEYGLRETARKLQDQYPEVHNIISNDVYVDDCISGSSSLQTTMKLSDEIEYVLRHGMFTLKGVTMSGKDPDPSLSSDGKTISVAGLKWHSRDDQITLDIKPLNFAKKYRGRKMQRISTVPLQLTRRLCTSKVGEIFDISGMITPITATMKLDLHSLVQRKLDWDDVIPDNLRQIWISHFQLMEEIRDIKFNRAVVPKDTASQYSRFWRCKQIVSLHSHLHSLQEESWQLFLSIILLKITTYTRWNVSTSWRVIRSSYQCSYWRSCSKIYTTHSSLRNKIFRQ